MDQDSNTLPAWAKTEDGYDSGDLGQNQFYMRCKAARFNLPVFDSWLVRLGDSKLKTELIERRQDAYYAAKRSNNDAFLRHVEVMQLKREIALLEDAMRRLYERERERKLERMEYVQIPIPEHVNNSVRAEELRDREARQTSGLKKKSRLTEEAKKAAQFHALQIWGKDERKELRISVVAEEVRGELMGSEHAHFCPQIPKIQDWIRPVSPEYARQRGRPKKK